MTRKLSIGTISYAVLASAIMSPSAHAQSVFSDPSTRFTFIDENGVDIRTGQWIVTGGTLSVGDNGDPALSLPYAYSSGYVSATQGTPQMGEAGHPQCDVDDSACQYSPDVVYIDYRMQTADDGVLSNSAGGETFTKSDGTVYTFVNKPDYDYGYNLATVNILSKIVKPSGETLDYYINSTANGGTVVVSNKGYMMVPSSNLLTNLAYENCNPNFGTCSTNNGGKVSVAIGSPTVSGGQTTTSVTDPMGGRFQTISSAVGAGSSRVATYTRISPAGVSLTATVKVVGASGYNPGVPVVSHVHSVAGDWDYSYQAGLNVYASARTSPTGLHFSATNSADGHISLTDENGHTRSMTSDIMYPTWSNNSMLPVDGNLVLNVINPEGDRVDYTHDARNNVTQIVKTSKTGATSVIFTAGYDAACGNIITCNRPNYTTDANGNRTDFTYDPQHGGVLTRTSPADTSGIRAQTRYTYQQLSARYNDPNGNRISGSPIWMLKSTKACRLQASCAGTAGEITKTYTYNDNLLLLTETTAAGDGSLTSVVTKTYDAIGNVIAVDGPVAGSADTTRYVYDANRRLTATMSADPDGSGPLGVQVVKTVYDGDGRATEVDQGTAANQSDGALSSMTINQKVAVSYDGAGRKSYELMSGAGVTQKATQYSYNADGRLECTGVRMNQATFSSLPASACTLGAEGAYGPDRITRNLYDPAGQVLKVQKAYGTPLQQDYATYTFSANGKQLTVQDANGSLATMSYDAFDRQQRWYFPSSTSVGQSNLSDYEEYGYDANDNRISVRKRDGRAFSFTYDALNRVARKVVPDGCAPIQTGVCPAISATRDVYYGYDLQGRQIYARFDSATGEGVNSAYDSLGHLTSTTLVAGGTNRTISLLYDSDGNRTRITHPDGTWFNYTYDNLDRPWQISDQNGEQLTVFGFNGQGLRSSAFAGAQQFTYDNVGRLTGQATAFGRPVDVSETLAYNPADQIVSDARSNDAYAYNGAVNLTRSYTVNGLNQYTSAGPAIFSYDANGNLVGDGTTSYGYDAENRVVTTSSGAALDYDPLGRLWRISRGGVTTQFLYTGDELTDEYGVSGNVLRRYVHGPSEDDPAIWYEGAGVSAAERRYLLSDHQGSIVLALDGNKNQVAINSYDEYGIPGSGNQGRFQYTGQAWLTELGMYYYKARMYSPTMGRFLQTDPIGYRDQINLYNYVANDPVNGVDPSGNRVVIYGSATYRAEVLREMRQLQSGPKGNELVHKLIVSPNEIAVQSHQNPTTPSDVRKLGNLTEAQNEANASNGKGTGSTVYFDPTNKGGVDVNGSPIRPSFVGLGHELGHSEDINAGRRADSAPRDLGPGTTPALEQNSVGRENQIRAEHNIPLRTTYDPPLACQQGPGKCQ